MIDVIPPKEIVQHKANGKCVCETCNCGKHKCPQPIVRGQYHSSYKGDFVSHDHYQPEGKYKMIHENFILPTGRFQQQSSYHNSFPRKDHRYSVSEKYVPKNQLLLGNDPFKGNSSYVNDYVENGKGQRAQRIPLPKNFIMPEGNFKGQTNYNADFITGKGQKLKKYRPVDELKVGEGRFEGHSNYGTQFHDKGILSKAEQIPFPKNQIFPEGRFKGDTLYHQSFIPGKAQKPQQYRLEGELKVGGNFQGESSYGADYANQGPGKRADKIPLPNNQIFPEGKFKGQTNYGNDFIEGKSPRPEKFRLEGQLKVGGKFEGHSSYGADFIPQGSGQRAQIVPYPRNQVLPQGKFQGNSSYVGDFEAKRNGLRADRIPLPQNQVFPEGKFNGNSSYSGDYIPGKYDRPAQFKPKQELKVGGKFQGSSTYLDNFVEQQKHHKERCPAEELHAPRYRVSERNHVHYNERTHKWE